MKLLCDENVESAIVRSFRSAGHDVVTLTSLSPAGTPDRAVLDRAEADDRVLNTNHKDFADLAYLQQRATTGIVLIRMPSSSGPDKADRLVAYLQQHGATVPGSFTSLGERAARRRPLR